MAQGQASVAESSVALPPVGERPTALIIPFNLDGSAFAPETVEKLSVAFEEAWRRIEKSSQPLFAAAAREIVAKHIIELARRGECDAVRLCNSAIEFWASTYEGNKTGRDYRPLRQI
jgi:hypothetical protein